MVIKVKTNTIKSNPANPRIIKNDKFRALVKSMKGFPEMLEKRAIVVDEDMIILGGNMRFKAWQETGFKDVWIDVAEGWTQKQKDEFTIKDNNHSGEWDWDILGNNWDNTQLKDWGMDVWQPEEDVDYSILDDEDLSSDMEDMTNGVKKAIQIPFELEHYAEAFELVKYWREQGGYVGMMLIEKLKQEKK